MAGLVIVLWIWVRFWKVPKCLFGICYIPPPDSEYYSHESFASIQEKLKTTECKEYCVVGDMNTRFGTFVRELPSAVDVPNCDSVSYPFIPDDVHSRTVPRVTGARMF